MMSVNLVSCLEFFLFWSEGLHSFSIHFSHMNQGGTNLVYDPQLFPENDFRTLHIANRSTVSRLQHFSVLPETVHKVAGMIMNLDLHKELDQLTEHNFSISGLLVT